MYDTAGITKDRLLFNDIVNWLQSLTLGWQNHIDAGKAFKGQKREHRNTIRCNMFIFYEETFVEVSS